MLIKKSSKNQVTLPKAVADLFPDTRYFEIKVEGGEIHLRPVTVRPYGETREQVRDKIEQLGLSEKDVTEAVMWARDRE